MSMSKRAGQLTELQAYGILDGGQPLAVELYSGGDTSRGTPRARRQLRADSTDAGQAFRLVGFYPNAQGGRVRLEVDLDGQGDAEKSGTLWVENFQILGDAVVSEVVSAGEQSGGRSARTVVRETIPFELMRAPFLVGYGQFVLQDASLKGPLLGASLRGRVDYEKRQLDLGGTYVPLQALNNMFGAIPVLGQIISGPRGEGIFGVTFAIQGSMERPQALVNPLSPLAPGIFREIFALTPQDPQVQRRQNRPGDPGGTSVRSWSPQTRPDN
ncbi:MAG: AsmA-like C-terminal region-containing protein [Pseudomonadota bacterium]